MILCRFPRKAEPPPLPCPLPAEKCSLPKALTASVSSALSSTLSISAYVVLFQTVAALLPPVPGIVLGAVEMVSGMATLSSGTAGFVAAAVLAAWGGVSVHCQTMSVAEGLSLKYHTAGKLLQTIISFFLALIAAKWVYR